MAFSTGLKALGFSLGLALSFVLPTATGAQAAPVGSALAYRDAAALPLENVQARRPVRRPVRAGRRGNNGAAVAGALIGAAILGGAIIANSQPRRPRAQYYYTDDGYPVEYDTPYYAPYYAPAPVYRPQTHYYQAPPVRRSRPVHNNSNSPMYNGPVRYQQPNVVTAPRPSRGGGYYAPAPRYNSSGAVTTPYGRYLQNQPTRSPNGGSIPQGVPGGGPEP